MELSAGGGICHPHFDDGKHYLCVKLIAQLHVNRAEKDPLRYRRPEGTEGFLCQDCLVEVLNARASEASSKGREFEDYDPF